MKKLFFAALLFGSIHVMGQQGRNENKRLEALQKETNQAALKKKIKDLENGALEDLDLLLQYYKKDPVKKAAVVKLLNKKYPESQSAKFARMTLFLDVKGGPEKTEELLQTMLQDYPGVNLDLERNLVALAYAEIPDTAKSMNYINAIQDPVYKVSAISMMTELLAPLDKDMTLAIASRGMEEANKIKGQTSQSVPLKLDPKQVYYDYTGMYGKLLFNAGKNEEAYKYVTEAYNNIRNKDGELVETYAFLSALKGEYEEALPVLAKAVKDGKHEKKYIDLVRAGYEKLNPGKDVDAYIASLQEAFTGKIKAEIKKQMINETAPDFTVTDVNGKKVTLADFKGKTIVIDFWATWCGPCVASFPAMQMAANRYANDPGVKFLFIHTWENVADPLADAMQFLEKRNYAFDLYMDPRNPATKHSPAADAFKVKGIPAKFIIDGNGKVRFKLEGFSGSQESAAEEVVQMVEMARKGA
ncbi:TlpA disulfide reductase family protein [Pseudoflavitalea rhizosphaerae]|uniref:TlpA disulfide reductase family protein n=1 Tax=Pseudoflavitalea rhizosphaerae TaxID=1884793 RepID=UPI000F8EB767|nr:TlpA disulfide reductase family protein [Pseudoflavitalea rhizosphaerae]